MYSDQNDGEATSTTDDSAVNSDVGTGNDSASGDTSAESTNARQETQSSDSTGSDGGDSGATNAADAQQTSTAGDTWESRAKRGLTLLDDSNDTARRTRCMLKKILDSNNRDDYVSRDFYNVQQTAGGLPEGHDFAWFLAKILGHLRGQTPYADTADYGLMSSNLSPDVSDADFKKAVLSFDDLIYRHITFLNGVVHQAAAGEVHVKLWNWILDQLKDDTSLYACYRDIVKDDR